MNNTQTAVGRNHTSVLAPQAAFTLINNHEALQRVWPTLSGPDSLAVDVETYGDRRGDALDPYKGEIRLLTLAKRGQPPFVIDLMEIGYECVDWPALFANREVIIHNAAFDGAWLLEKLHVKLKQVWCTLSAAKLLSNGDKSLHNDLGSVLERFLAIRVPKELGASDWGGLFLVESQVAYAANDVAHLHNLRDQLEINLQAMDLMQVFELEMRLVPIVLGMQAYGMPVCVKKLQGVLEAATAKRKSLEPKLSEYLGYWKNFNSYDQVKEAFGAIGISLEDTSESTLVPCSHPAASLLLQYREADMERRQAAALLAAVHDDGRIRCQFRSLGPETGRFASSGPNLQNIGNGPLRDCFKSLDEDRVLIIKDYEQVELRASAWIAQDPVMLEAFKRGDDLHTQTASAVLGKPKAEVTRDDRKLAKACNFGLVYGQRAKGFVGYVRDKFGIELTIEEAQGYIRQFFKLYEGLGRWHREAWQEAPGVTEGRTVLGRRRLLADDDPDWKRFQAQINYVVQGGCADALKTAMVLLADRLPQGAHLVATVHDEVILEAPRSIAQEVLNLTRDAMIEAFERLFPGMPVEVDGKVCNHWGEK
jgi:DNA polymerase I